MKSGQINFLITQGQYQYTQKITFKHTRAQRTKKLLERFWGKMLLISFTLLIIRGLVGWKS